MDQTQAVSFVREAVRIIFHRTVSPSEIESWTQELLGSNPTDFLTMLHQMAVGQQQPEILTHWKNGHYYSPVVDPNATVRAYWQAEQALRPDEIPGLRLDTDEMVAFWSLNSDYLLSNPFPDHPNMGTRYYNVNGSFPGGDAVFLGAILRHFRPRRIIEIGSGNSTAAMLDWAERLLLHDLRITCVEPDPDRLRSLLKPGDDVTIIQSQVQDVGPELFSELDAGDILFIDSTHVLKTGSDVHYELFHILPRVAKGVIIHFHDCAYPFEYPAEAVFDMNFSWNEAYAVRSFLMYNSAFNIFFWNSMFYRFCDPNVRAEFNRLSTNPGGGLWVIKNADG